MGSPRNSKQADNFILKSLNFLLAGCLATSPLALAAQDRTAPPSLEDLIPDSAVDNPEEWAHETATDEVADADSIEAEPQPDTPMAELPDLSVDWPDELLLAEPDVIEPSPAEEGSEEAFVGLEEFRREPRPEQETFDIGRRLVIGFPDDEDGFPEKTEFIERFRQLSTVRELSSDESTVAQISARAKEDEALLEDLLRVYGYYDAQVFRIVGAYARPSEDEAYTEPRVRFDVQPGQRYTFGAIDLGALDTAPDYQELRTAFDIQPGDPVNSDRIVSERFDLDTALGETGYPFAAIEDPELLIDHAREEGDLAMAVQPGGKYVFGEVTSSQPKFLSGKHFQRFARFDQGDVYQRSLEQDLRRAVIATGLVSSVTIETREVRAPTPKEPGEVALDVNIEKAKVRTIAGAIGYGSEDGVKIEASWEHRNFFPPEGAVKVRGILGTQEQLAGVSFTRNNFRDRDQVLSIDAYASDLETESVDARTIALRGSFEKLSNLLFQKPFSWSIGAEALYTDERNRVVNGIERPRQEYLIGAVFGSATIDTSDSLLDPTEGYRLTGYLAPEVSRSQGQTSVYLRNQFDATYYKSVSEGTVLAARGRVATIQGADLTQIAPSRRLYAGGGGSIRGYGYQAVGPRNEFGETTGGRSLVEASFEARIGTGFLDGAVQIVPFVDVGSVSTSTYPDFETIKVGAGLGLRYKTGFGPIRVDVGVPLNPDPDDSPVAVYVSLGQAF